MAILQKKSSPLTREEEAAASSLLGKHVSHEKALLLAVVTVLLCLTPTLTGLRLWNQMPESIVTGITGASGKDDSIPRRVMVFGIPCLFALMDLICHGQLFLSQKAQRLPPVPVRLLGRWGIPVTALLLGNWGENRAAGQALNLSSLLLLLLTIILLLTGSAMFDAKQGSSLTLPFRFAQQSDRAHTLTHRLTGCGLMAAGLMIAGTFTVSAGLPPLAGAAVLLLLAAPPIAAYGIFRQRP